MTFLLPVDQKNVTKNVLRHYLPRVIGSSSLFVISDFTQLDLEKNNYHDQKTQHAAPHLSLIDLRLA